MEVSNGLTSQAAEITIPELVAEVYEGAPATERGHLLEQLLRPLGVLSLVAIADGMLQMTSSGVLPPPQPRRLCECRHGKRRACLEGVVPGAEADVDPNDGRRQKPTLKPSENSPSLGFASSASE